MTKRTWRRNTEKKAEMETEEGRERERDRKLQVRQRLGNPAMA